MIFRPPFLSWTAGWLPKSVTLPITLLFLHRFWLRVAQMKADNKSYLILQWILAKITAFSRNLHFFNNFSRKLIFRPPFLSWTAGKLVSSNTLRQLPGIYIIANLIMHSKLSKLFDFHLFLMEISFVILWNGVTCRYALSVQETTLYAGARLTWPSARSTMSHRYT